MNLKLFGSTMLVAMSALLASEPGFGYVVHDGVIDNKFAPGTPEAEPYENDHQLLGSRDLFRTTLALEREFGDRFATRGWTMLDCGSPIGSIRMPQINTLPRALGSR